ncbi:MAG: hypothetical protein IJB34_07035 [Clostridia bacterium]|nr:hypothetical protein [Clostridia bacterium]MBQ3506748.1 hypothetical protein [Clostridia bacterium]
MKLIAICITNNATAYGGAQPLRQIVLFVFVPFDKNTLGDIVAIWDGTGQVVAEYEYDAWGNITYQYGSIASVNPFRYRGYYYDTETGFYYLQTRYYDPTICRFINADNYELVATLSQSVGELNMYAYCGNNPIMYTDPTGQAFISILVGLGIAALIGAAIGAASYTVGQIADYAITGDFEWSWGGFIGSTIGCALGGMIAYALPYIGIGSVAVGAFFSGAATTDGTMIGQNITDNTNYSVIDILLNSVIVGGFSALSIGVMSRIRIPRLNAGRGSCLAVSNQIYTKFRNQMISRITMKTFRKMIAVEAYNGIAGAIFEGIYDFSGISDKVLGWF